MAASRASTGHGRRHRDVPDRGRGGRIVLAMSRETLIPIALACVLVGLTYGLGLTLGWSSGAMGVGAVVACVATAATRVLLAHAPNHGPTPAKRN
jgi:hypothetical protein